ncbi:unnamed protein product [Didymodactylos carnosus]|uniref:Uncharacterized protein n=1 Tax=Didymodactylos carnosus TaxID=1234261 RepID=A0A814YW04_9BILA|nr:unnamed protein product [Didymodactylos carnosus]CAF3997637.1 unnamed protein product [Didymodactylos carnosus]
MLTKLLGDADLAKVWRQNFLFGSIVHRYNKLMLYTCAQEANLFVENYIQHYQTTESLYYPIKACVAVLNKAAFISRGRVLKNGLIIVDKQDGTTVKDEEDDDDKEKSKEKFERCVME